MNKMKSPEENFKDFFKKPNKAKDYNKMEEKRILRKEYRYIKSKLESQGIQVLGYKVIDYGIQFFIKIEKWKGLMRVYMSKRKKAKYDYALFKDKIKADAINNLLTGQSTLF